MRVACLLAVTALAALPLAVPASAQQIAPAAVVPAMDVFVDDLINLRNIAVSCSDIEAALVDTEWDKMRGSLIATLWANGFPADFVESAEDRTAAPVDTNADCSDPDLLYRSETQARGGWGLRFQQVFPALGAKVVPYPVTADMWARIEEVADHHGALEARVLACTEVQSPFAQPIEVATWMAIVGKVGAALLESGARHPDIAALLTSLDANTLWQRTPPAERAAALTACNEDQSWFEYSATFSANTLPSEIEALLPPR